MEERKILAEQDLKAAFDSFNELTCVLQNAVNDHIDCMEQICDLDLCKDKISSDEQNRIYDLGVLMMYRMQLIDYVFAWATNHHNHHVKFKKMHDLAMTDLENHGYEFETKKRNDNKDPFNQSSPF